MPDPRPIRPRVKDDRAYERSIRTAYLVPLFRDLRTRLGQVGSAAEANAVIQQVVERVQAQVRGGVPLDKVIEALRRVEAYHKARTVLSFRAALGVDIRPFLLDAQVQDWLRARIAENVDLIKTIPPRMHASLRARMLIEFNIDPFNQEAMTKLLREEFRSSGYNLRRIVRDQNSKLIGQLTQMRQQQAGVTAYVWMTAADERVRDSHRANNGRTFLWSGPPGTGHPGSEVQCRCLARAIITPANKARLKR